MLELEDKNMKSHCNCILSIQKPGEKTGQGNKRHGGCENKDPNELLETKYYANQQNRIIALFLAFVMVIIFFTYLVLFPFLSDSGRTECCMFLFCYSQQHNDCQCY